MRGVSLLGHFPQVFRISPTTGVISGTPTTQGTSTFTVQVQDSTTATAAAQVSITVVSPLTLAGGPQPDGIVGVALQHVSRCVGRVDSVLMEHCGRIIAARSRHFRSDRRDLWDADSERHLRIHRAGEGQSRRNRDCRGFYNRQLAAQPDECSCPMEPLESLTALRSRQPVGQLHTLARSPDRFPPACRYQLAL